MTATTPIYGLKYIVQGEPIRNTRQALEDNAFTIETALQAAGVAAVGASDLLAVSGRVSAIESPTMQPVTFASGYAQYTTSPYGELVRCWKPTPDTVRVAGMVAISTAVSTGATGLLFATLPAGYRPAVTVNRTIHYQSTNPLRCLIAASGAMSLVPAVALAAGQWMQLDFEFRTVNT